MIDEPRLLKELETSLSPEMRLACIQKGRSGYRQIAGLVARGRLNERQLVNSIGLLFELATETAFGEQGHLAALLCEVALHDSVRVRSEATWFAIALVDMAEKFKNCDISPLSRNAIASRIREIAHRGFSSDHRNQEQRIAAFLAQSS